MKLNQQIHHAESISRLVGVQDRNLLVFKQYLGVSVSIRGGSEIITDAKPDMLSLLEAIFAVLIKLAEHQIQFNERDVMYIIKLAEKDELTGVFDLYKNREKNFN